MSSKRIAIIYGSETGNGHDFATILSHKLTRLHFPHALTTIGDYNPKDLLNCRHLFIICSTTGQGVLPRNARESIKGDSKGTLWAFLKKKNLPSDFLNHLDVALLGLGDSSYSRFNYAIRKLHKRIVEQLGAKELFPHLEADDAGLAGSSAGSGTGVEAVYLEYEKRILSFLTEIYPTRTLKGIVIKRESIPDEVYLRPATWLAIDDGQGVPSKQVTFSGDETVKFGKITANKRITAEDHFQDVRHFVFQAQDDTPYYAGDTVSIYPNNLEREIALFIETQPHWREVIDKPLKICGDDGARRIFDGGLVQPLTLRNLLKYHCSILSIPTRVFFMKIWTFATNKNINGGEQQFLDQREKLKQFAFSEDQQDLYDYCNRPRRSILEVLCDFESLKLPWEFVLDYLPAIKPRFFSISGSPCNRNIELTVAIVRYKTILRRVRRGLCTSYMSQLRTNDTVRYKIQNNDLLGSKIEKDHPIIMISPGVGIAPIMCVIRSNMFKEMLLFFGNRYKNKDFLYRETLEKWHDEQRIKLYACFSRCPQDSPGLKYVQDSLWKNWQEVADLIVNRNAVIYLCGSSGKMPIQVRLTIAEILKKSGFFSGDKEAELYLKEMEKNDRYLQETW
ncbi:HBL167Wp [Eremothecium sinecaudum]|uniref:NADPH-dependent diflavin oxidoreductase 1 n=1 Tax=Eremothecium sinecaudum TaxID=45286 RepID=A0A120K0V9_9SACH|nr:HBL167Wp [Eremothecium sinecaudum]AMD18735.1 HBL167Wp [Eremothecium sinecaudum]